MQDQTPFGGPYDADRPAEDADAFDRASEQERRHREEMRAVEEAGGGESEGFELAEQELIEHTSHGDLHTPARIMRDASAEEELVGLDYGEADEERKPD